MFVIQSYSYEPYMCDHNKDEWNWLTEKRDVSPDEKHTFKPYVNIDSNLDIRREWTKDDIITNMLGGDDNNKGAQSKTIQLQPAITSVKYRKYIENNIRIDDLFKSLHFFTKYNW